MAPTPSAILEKEIGSPQKEPELSVDAIAKNLKINFKTASEHMRRLALSGLVMKRYEGNYVRHKLTERGETILKFLRILE